MQTPSRLVSICLIGLLLAAAACSSGSPSTETPPPHDASVDTAAQHHPDAAPTPDATDATDASPPPDVFVPARMPGQRTPLSASCDAVDGTRCLLPWPSNTFTVADSTTGTGLRLAVAQQGIIASDNPTSINRADGFSRVSPILTGFAGTLDKTTLGDLTTGSVRLIVEQPGETFGQIVSLKFDTVAGNSTTTPESLLVAYPRAPLAPATDYAVVVMNSAHFTDGTALTPDREAQVALGLAAPETSSEGALYAYDAPARAAMKAAGIDPTEAVRVWDFTTRSLLDPTTDLVAMSAAERAAFDSSPAASLGANGDAGTSLDAGADGGTGIGIVFDSITTAPTGSVLTAITGRITGVPSYLTPTGALSRDAAGGPTVAGVHDVLFRAAIPVGTGSYRIVMYGHGLGGAYDETSFDQEITTNGAVKVGTPFMGWTESSIGNTFALFADILSGSEIATDELTQSLADTRLVQHALGGSLGRLLGASTINGVANPAAGRYPNTDQPIWAGGSLGGTMGFVYTAAEPAITAGVLNVPGGAWSQFVTYSEIFQLVRIIMTSNYPDPIDVQLGVTMSQLNFDPVDGTAWYDAVGDHFPILLEQESIGDPVLPNIGNEMVAAASHADQVGVVLNPIVGCTDVQMVANHSAMTQFKVPSSVTDDLQIHGFAAGTTPAGIAAQQQIVAFIASVWAGAPVITIPPECVTNTPANSCDFSASP